MQLVENAPLVSTAFAGGPGTRLRILTLSCVFPSSNDPAYGIFVRRRSEALAILADVKVIAPVAALDYSQLRRGFRHTPALHQNGSLDVRRPRWFYPPAGGGANAVFLFLRLLAPVLILRSSWQFNVLDAHFGYPDGIAAALLAIATGAPFSVTLRGNEPMHARHWFRGALLRWSLRRAGLVIAVSESLKQFALRAGARPSRIAVIPNGVDASVFYPRHRCKSRERHGIPLDTQVVLSAGSLVERKGHHRVIEAVASLRKTGYPLHLIIVGGPGREGDFEAEIRAAAAASGMDSCVRLFGAASSDTLAELMSAADLLCLASTREGWPNVVHESLACGTPVVATETGAVAAMTAHGRFGLVVPPSDRNALKQAIREGLGREWDRGEISAWAQSRSWDRVGQEVLERLQNLAGQHPGAANSVHQTPAGEKSR